MKSRRAGCTGATGQIFKESVSPTDRDKVWTDYVVLFHGILSGVVSAVRQSGAVLGQFAQCEF